MRGLTAVAAVALMLLLDAHAGRAQAQAPWCAQYDWTTYNCGFYTFEQCMQNVRGIGGYCYQNPYYAGRSPYEQRRAPRKRDRRQRH